jgi:threonine aldolase
MPRPIDLRSDTVTQPSAAMREAMAAAPVGDDCYDDDPTVHELQARVAERLGKAAAVFVPSGTMANQLAVHLHCRSGQALACSPGAHVQIHEDASAARLSGVQIMPIGTVNGYDSDALSALLAEETCGWPTVGLVWIENTLGTAGGRIWPLESAQAISRVARAAHRPVHLDGARLWNAHVATGLPLAELAAFADSVSVCTSKGLGAPAGSLLAGDEAFVARARTVRHAFGGSMRQAGVLAAAGCFALEHNVARLAEDHARAHRLAAALADLPVWRVVPPETNVVLFDVAPSIASAETLCAPLRAAGVLCWPNVYRQVRFVLHLGVSDADVDDVIERVRATLRSVTC